MKNMKKRIAILFMSVVMLSSYSVHAAWLGEFFLKAQKMFKTTHKNEGECYSYKMQEMPPECGQKAPEIFAKPVWLERLFLRTQERWLSEIVACNDNAYEWRLYGKRDNNSNQDIGKKNFFEKFSYLIHEIISILD